MMKAKSIKTEAGFSLIELMIVVAIVGIIAAFAYPSYQSHVLKTRRAQAQADLLELAQFMERRYSTAFDYRDAGADPTLPFSTSPRNTNQATAYNISFVGSVTRTTFQLQAAPTALQSADPCGTITLNEQGVRTAGQADCW